MRRPSSLLARGLEPLFHSLWTLLLVWTGVVAILWLRGDEIVGAIANPGLRSAASLILGTSDAIWLVIAATNLYLHLAETEGLARTRIITLSIAAAAGALAAASAWTGYPLGTVASTRLGLKLGPMPLAWPVLWFVIVVSGRSLAARVFPRANHASLAAFTGTLALLTDLNLEPIATKLRLYWFWYEAETRLPADPLWRNYVCWFLVAGALAWLIREEKLGAGNSDSWRPGLIIIGVNAMLVLGHARFAIGG
jgi:Carotenoid biosynthesis protein